MPSEGLVNQAVRSDVISYFLAELKVSRALHKILYIFDYESDNRTFLSDDVFVAYGAVLECINA